MIYKTLDNIIYKQWDDICLYRDSYLGNYNDGDRREDNEGC
jgi:hypothetical protein